MITMRFAPILLKYCFNIIFPFYPNVQKLWRVFGFTGFSSSSVRYCKIMEEVFGIVTVIRPAETSISIGLMS